MIVLATSVTNCLANLSCRAIPDLLAFSIQRGVVWLAHAHLTTYFGAVVATQAGVTTFRLASRILSAAYDWDADIVDPCESIVTLVFSTF